MQNLGCELVVRGDSPILVVTPHTGTQLPAELLQRAAWVPVQGRVADPAGLLLHGAARGSNASLIAARYHPCVIDFIVAADSRSLSPGLNRVGLCRTHTSRGEALYEPGAELTANEVETRIERYWRPFHRSIATELERLRALHNHVLLFVSHASWWLSPYRLQGNGRDCNVGTNQGKACSRLLVSVLTEMVQARGGSWVVNGSFADGFMAQHYGNPAAGIHVLEVEFSGRWRSDCAAQLDNALVGSHGGAMRQSLGDDQPGNDQTAMASMLTAFERTLGSLPAVQCVKEGGHVDAPQL